MKMRIYDVFNLQLFIMAMVLLKGCVGDTTNTTNRFDKRNNGNGQLCGTRCTSTARGISSRTTVLVTTKSTFRKQTTTRISHNASVTKRGDTRKPSERTPNPGKSIDTYPVNFHLERMKAWFNVTIHEAPNPTVAVKIILQINMASVDLKGSLYVAYLVSQRYCQDDPQPRTEVFNNSGNVKWPNALTWFQAENRSCTAQYQATPEFWTPFNWSLTTRNPIHFEYIIGQFPCKHANEYCNGPLKPGKHYLLYVRIISGEGFTDLNPKPFQTKPDDNATILILNTVTCCVLVILSIVLLTLWLRLRWSAAIRPQTEMTYKKPSDVSMKKFLEKYEELFRANQDAVTPAMVSEEFDAINNFSDFFLNETTTNAIENEIKNRYNDILPFDSNRVFLDANETDESNATDYINASFVQGYKYQREYIATQGPKPDTCYDFWRMILQYEVESIVMLTQPIDLDKNKCCMYYSRLSQTIEYGDIQVKCTQEMNLSLYYKRLFVVSKGNQSQTVFHYHFLDWPDYGCPASLSDLIEFSKIIRAERKSYAIPLVVHCSAGVGRTGTFIALDIILQKMQQEKKINVYDTVTNLRRQRMWMVQTIDQYAFLYQCCLECITKADQKTLNACCIGVTIGPCIKIDFSNTAS